MGSEDKQLSLLNYVGTTLYGFCQGHFGDSYGEKEIVGISARWVVVKTEDLDCEDKLIDIFRIASFENSQELIEFIVENIKEDY